MIGPMKNYNKLHQSESDVRGEGGLITKMEIHLARSVVIQAVYVQLIR